jgi:hypothetical protein
MSPRISERISRPTLIGAASPPRNPDEDDDEKNDDEADEDEPAVIREPDEDE